MIPDLRPMDRRGGAVRDRLPVPLGRVREPRPAERGVKVSGDWTYPMGHAGQARDHCLRFW